MRGEGWRSREAWHGRRWQWTRGPPHYNGKARPAELLPRPKALLRATGLAEWVVGRKEKVVSVQERREAVLDGENEGWVNG